MSRRLSKLVIAVTCVLALAGCRSTTGPSYDEVDNEVPAAQQSSHQNSGT